PWATSRARSRTRSRSISQRSTPSSAQTALIQSSSNDMGPPPRTVPVDLPTFARSKQAFGGGQVLRGVAVVPGGARLPRRRDRDGPQGAEEPAQRRARVGAQRGPQLRGAPAAGEPLLTAPGRSPIASSSRATWAGRRNGMSAASSASRGARTSASPARSAGTGPAPGGSSRTTTAPGSTPRGGPTTISRDAPDTAAAAHSIRARPPSGAAGLSAPNRRARPPASRTA